MLSHGFLLYIVPKNPLGVLIDLEAGESVSGSKGSGIQRKY